MPSNFQFLRSEWAPLFKNAQQAELHATTAPVTSAFYGRLTLEMTVDWMFENDGDLDEPYEHSLSARMYAPSFKELVPQSIYREITYVRKEGNNAVHGRRISPYVSMASLKYLHRFLIWIAELYSEETPEIVPFDEAFIPTRGFAQKKVEELQRLQLQFEQQQQALKKEQEKLLQKDAEIEKLKAQLAATKTIKEQHKHIPLPASPFSEAETRTLFIDAMLREAGWDPAGPKVAEYPLSGIPKHINKTGRGYADYVLWGDDGLPLAVLEAKQTQLEVYRGQHQSEVYANCLEQMHGQRPIIFFTNGFETWLWDDQFYPPRQVHGFYTKEELRLLIQRRKNRKDLRKATVNKTIAGRHYQIEAIRRVAEAYCGEMDGQLKGAGRAALIVMATGAGKTRVSAAIVDLLTKSNWAKRVLFLADRNALVTQAKNRYKELLPHLSSIDLTKEKEDDTTRLVFSTYPTIMNRIDSARSDDERFYGVGHFDLIIVDEAHRSIYQKYQAIFAYFDALLLGLTATPRDEADRDTYELFDCEVHNPTAFYELDEAVRDQFLVPPQGKSVDLGFVKRGIKYEELSDADKLKYEETFRDEAGGVPSEINAAAINQWLFNADTIDKVLDHLMTYGLKVEGGDKLGKTIVFARNHNHAIEIQRRFNKQYPLHSGKFLKVIDNYDKFAQQSIDDFSIANKYPQVAVSVDMLDTGIDVPEIVNLVFFKPVYSSAKYWQMIGRGTRLCPDIFGPGQPKENFYIFDFCGNFEFFGHHPDGLTSAVPESLSQKIFKSRLELAQLIGRKKLQDQETYRKALLDLCQQEVAKLFDQRDNFRIKMALGYVDKYRHRYKWDDLKQHHISEIFEHVAPLVKLSDDDEKAKRYDLLLLRLQLALLENLPERDALVQRIVNLSRKLKSLENIPRVKQQIALIDATLKGEFWQQIDLDRLENVRSNLRDLIRLIPKDDLPIYKTNFQDTIDGSSDVDVMPPYIQMESYKQRVERYIRENQHHITISKLKTNTPITAQELEALENMLFDGSERGSKEDFVREFGAKPLGVFIRSIVGLDKEAANQAFAGFIQTGNLSADQMNFIKSIIDHLTINGTIDKRMLMNPPFTDLHYMGILGVFEEEEAMELVKVIDGVNENAWAVG